MLVSKLFSETVKQDPAGEESINARWLTRAGYVYKNMAGVYSYLPLGFRVLQNIRQVIREELNNLGAQEVYLNELQPKELWQKTGRWQELAEIMYQFKDDRGKEIGLAITHEEVVAEIAKSFISSYKDLPQAIYQIQDKFRDEPRARSGLLRGREFEMKDLYSFHADETDMERYYGEVRQAYLRIFKRLGFEKIYLTEAAGGSFTKEYSHEFQVLAPAGEDTIFVCEKCQLAKNKEIAEDKPKCSQCQKPMIKKRSIELGNIFKLGTKFSEALGLKYHNDKGQEKPVVMASFGIGTGRVMGALAETLADQQGLVWPQSVAPFQAYLINLDSQKIKLTVRQEDQILLDDRPEVSPGEKFSDADLLGLPFRIIKSAKTGSKVEIKERKTGKIELTTWEEFVLKLRL